MSKVYKIHSAANAFPRMPKSEFDELKEDIKTHGIRVPLLVNKQRNTIYDGISRIRAAHDLNLPDKDVPLEVFTGTEEQVVAEIVSRNIMRRNLTDDQRVALLAKLLGRQFAADGKERMSEGGKGLSNSANLPAHAHVRLADGAQTTKHKARQALDVDKHAPKDLDNVIAGKEKLATAAKKARAKAGKTKKPKPQKSLQERVAAKFLRLMESFAVTEYAKVRAILRDLLANAMDA
jgi:ParB-like chromosome segregation protein Spo0J